MTGLYDMHCHLIPGVDDGAASMEEAVRLVEMEYAQGVRGILLTPHYRHGLFETEPSTVRERYDALLGEVGGRFPDLRFFLGWEYHACVEMKDELKGRDRFVIGDTDYVLVEFSMEDTQKYILNRLRDLLSVGLTPIVAHAERVPVIVGNEEFLRILRRNGVLLQVNADSVVGKMGFRQKRRCLQLFKNGEVDLIGSDAHDPEVRIPRMDECARLLIKTLGLEETERIMIDNPKNILRG